MQACGPKTLADSVAVGDLGVLAISSFAFQEAMPVAVNNAPRTRCCEQPTIDNRKSRPHDMLFSCPRIKFANDNKARDSCQTEIACLRGRQAHKVY